MRFILKASLQQRCKSRDLDEDAEREHGTETNIVERLVDEAHPGEGSDIPGDLFLSH
jgi:hypothetical protein